MAEAHGSGAATIARPGLSPVTFPQLGESVVEGTVLQWLVKVGDTVEEDQLLTEIETEKVVAEIPSPFKGVVKEFAVEIGQTVPVGTTLLWVETDAAAAAEAANAPTEAVVVAEVTKSDPETDNATSQMENAPEPPAPQPHTASDPDRAEQRREGVYRVRRCEQDVLPRRAQTGDGVQHRPGDRQGHRRGRPRDARRHDESPRRSTEC